MEGLKPGRIVYFRDSVGDVPSIVVKVHNDEGVVNLLEFIDGPNPQWRTSVPFTEKKVLFTWHWMFEGQQTRYTPDRQEVTR